MTDDAGKGYVSRQVELNNRLLNKVELLKIEVRLGVRGLRVGRGSSEISAKFVMSASAKKKKRFNYVFKNSHWKSRVLCWIERAMFS